jgi:hypothetical protein
LHARCARLAYLVATQFTDAFDAQGCELTINKLPLVCASMRGGMRPARADRG